MLSHIFLSLFVLSLTTAQQASNFNVTSTEASSYDCGAECQEILQVTNAIDLSTLPASFDFDFYATASNFTGSQPGDLLKLEPVKPSTLHGGVRPGTTVFRFQYTSKDLNGTLVPVTGFIAFPYAASMSSGSYGTPQFPLVAFAHGTIGIFRGCAPSSSPELWDYNSWSLLIERGYAVIATDYAGLGNNATLHKYCSFPAHANDLYYSVVAARHAFGSVLSDNWMSVGHSQGGGSVWKLAESEYVQNDKTYLGTVALAPATHIVNMTFETMQLVQTVGDIHQYVVTAELPYLALALQRADPTYDLNLLGPALKQRIGLAEEAQLCTTAFMGLTLDLNITGLVSAAGLKNDTDRLLQWQKEMAPALGARSRAPILVVQGLKDTSVSPNTTTESWKQSCAAGNEVHLRLYPKMDHSPLLPASAWDWLGWMESRFRREETNGSCSMETTRPFDLKYVKAPPEFNFKALVGAI